MEIYPMKKLLLASAVAALSLSAANAAPTVYGKAFLTADYADIGDESNTQLNSNSSRIGFKGSEALTANTDVIYQLEFGVNIDAGDEAVRNPNLTYDANTGKIVDEGNGSFSNKKSDQFYSRDTYLGVKNAQYGTFMAGRLTGIDDYVDFADVTEGRNIGYVGPSYDENRLDNAFVYMSPDYNGLQILALYALDADQDSTSNEKDDQYGIGATYASGPMNLGGSYIAYGDISHARVSGNYAVTPELKVGALYQLSDYDTDDNENSFMLSADMKTQTPWTVYGQVNMSDNIEGNKDHDEFGVALGGRYAFSKAATGHLYAGYRDIDIDNTNDDGFGLGGGLEYKF